MNATQTTIKGKRYLSRVVTSDGKQIAQAYHRERDLCERSAYWQAMRWAKDRSIELRIRPNPALEADEVE